MDTLKSSVAALGWAVCAAAIATAQPALAQPAATQRSYRVGAFDSVAAAGPPLVIVHVGGAPAVRQRGRPTRSTRWRSSWNTERWKFARAANSAITSIGTA